MAQKCQKIALGPSRLARQEAQLPKLPGLRWLDSDYYPQGAEQVRALPKVSRPSRWLPFIFLHLGALAAFTIPVAPVAIIVAASLYWLRMFAVTAFYHRYFSHRTFKTSRLAQFFFAYLATSSGQRGPLWWAAHHRSHHRLSDQPGDLHSPSVSGLLWSHVAWITADANMPTDYGAVKDLVKYPELVLLNRFDWVPPTTLALSLLLLGFVLEKLAHLWAPAHCNCFYGDFLSARLCSFIVLPQLILWLIYLALCAMRLVTRARTIFSSLSLLLAKAGITIITVIQDRPGRDFTGGK